MSDNDQFVALVLAADRGSQDAVARFAGTACKAYAPICGQPMIIRVLDTLNDCHNIKSILLCGPPQSLVPACEELDQRINTGQVGWVENLDSPARSAAHAMNQIDALQQVMLTTADHALLTPEIVEYFLQVSRSLECDATVGIVRYETLQSRYGNARRTVIRLRDGNFCGCNLFAFKASGRALVEFWQQAEALRKQPWKMVNRVLGWQAVWLYLLGRLTLDQALQRISEKTGVRVCPVILPFPDAGIDVDKVEDLQLVRSVLAQSGSASV